VVAQGYDCLRKCKSEYSDVPPESFHCTISRRRLSRLTNFATAQHRQASRAAGADAFLDKSQDFGLVPQLLREWIDSAASDASPEIRAEQKH
jgi:hypothetical protein